MDSTTTVNVGTLRPEVKEKWLAALRSGEYREGVSHLYYLDGDRERYCCLGVLCDLAVKEGVIEAPHLRGDDVYEYGARGSASFPPDEVATWAYEKRPPVETDEWTVVKEHEGVDGYAYRTTFGLAELNDERGLTFPEIADRIEESL